MSEPTKLDERVYVSSKGKTGTINGWDFETFFVRLEGEDETRFFPFADVESIEPYPEGHPEGERLQRIGERIIQNLLSTRPDDTGETGES